jgi:hypothetical protein
VADRVLGGGEEDIGDRVAEEEIEIVRPSVFAMQAALWRAKIAVLLGEAEPVARILAVYERYAR